MSIYIIPITSSLMMQLVLMVEIPGVATTPMDMVPWGTSEAISNGSGVRRQAVTPTKLCGGVVGHMPVLARRVWMGWESSIEGLEALLVQPWRAGLVLLSGLKALHGGEISPAATTGQEGYRIFSHPKNFGLLSVGNSGVQGILGMLAGRVSRL